MAHDDYPDDVRRQSRRISELQDEVAALRERVNAIDHLDDGGMLRRELRHLAAFLSTTAASKEIRNYITDMMERLKL